MAAAAGIGAAASLLGGALGGKGAAKAAKIQAKAYQSGIDEQRRQFDTTQANFAPYLAGGNQALTGYLGLSGLNGNDGQGAAINALTASPLYQSQVQAGDDALLQNAAATGGLRGGNIQSALATQRASSLNQLIQQQLSNLGGLVSIGSGGIAKLGQLGQDSANSQSSLLANQGTANALGAASPYGALAGALKSLATIGGGLSFGGSKYTPTASPLGIDSIAPYSPGAVSDLSSLINLPSF